MSIFADISFFECLDQCSGGIVVNRSPCFVSELETFIGLCKECDKKLVKLSGNGLLGSKVAPENNPSLLNQEVQDLKSSLLDLSEKWDATDAPESASKKVNELFKEAEALVGGLQKKSTNLLKVSAQKLGGHRGRSYQESQKANQEAQNYNLVGKQLLGEADKMRQQVVVDYKELRRICYAAQLYLNTCAKLGFNKLTNSQLKLYQTILESAEANRGYDPYKNLVEWIKTTSSQENLPDGSS